TNYIRNRLAHSELTTWTVVLVSVQQGTPYRVHQYDIGLTTRTPLEDLEDRIAEEGLYSIKRVLNPPDEWIDFSSADRDEARAKAVEEWKQDPGKRKTEPDEPSGLVVRRSRAVERGLLIVYPIEPPTPYREDALRRGRALTERPIIGFAASFPASPRAPA